MATRPVADVNAIDEVPLTGGPGPGDAVVYKMFLGEVWERLWATPTSDVGATQYTVGADFTTRGMTDITPVPTATVLVYTP